MDKAKCGQELTLLSVDKKEFTKVALYTDVIFSANFAVIFHVISSSLHVIRLFYNVNGQKYIFSESS